MVTFQTPANLIAHVRQNLGQSDCFTIEQRHNDDFARLTGDDSYAAIVKRGEPLPASVSFLKLWATETHERIALALTQTAAEHGGGEGAARFGGPEIDVLARLVNALAGTIFSEMRKSQRGILANQALALPG